MEIYPTGMGGLDAGCWMLDAGHACGVVDAGCWMLDSGGFIRPARADWVTAELTIK